MKTDFKLLLSKLSENNFDFIVIGGFVENITQNQPGEYHLNSASQMQNPVKLVA